jgi:copper chaperone
MYLFNVKTMTCAGCAAAITRAITAVDKSAKVRAFPSIHRLEVETHLSAGQLLHLLDEAGYPAEPVQEGDNDH